MEVVLRKWGNSMAVRFPSALIKSCHLKEASKLVITEESGKIVLTPKKRQPRYDLKTLIAQMFPANQHEAVDFGEPVGQELL